MLKIISLKNTLNKLKSLLCFFIVKFIKKNERDEKIKQNRIKKTEEDMENIWTKRKNCLNLFRL